MSFSAVVEIQFFTFSSSDKLINLHKNIVSFLGKLWSTIENKSHRIKHGSVEK